MTTMEKMKLASEAMQLKNTKPRSCLYPTPLGAFGSVWSPRPEDWPIKPWPPVPSLACYNHHMKDEGNDTHDMVPFELEEECGDETLQRERSFVEALLSPEGPVGGGKGVVASKLKTPTYKTAMLPRFDDSHWTRDKDGGTGFGTPQPRTPVLLSREDDKLKKPSYKAALSQDSYKKNGTPGTRLSPLISAHSSTTRFDTVGILFSPVESGRCPAPEPSHDELSNEDSDTTAASDGSSITTTFSMINCNNNVRDSDSCFVRSDSEDDEDTPPATITINRNGGDGPDEDKENNRQCKACKAWKPKDQFEPQEWVLAMHDGGVCTTCEWKTTTKVPRRRRSKEARHGPRSSTFKRRQERRPLATLPEPPRINEAYKTKLCIHWQKGKGCLYGKACLYAHGEEELLGPRRVNSTAKGTRQVNAPPPPPPPRPLKNM